MSVKPDQKPAWQPNPEVMELWPDISGNTVNGLGEMETRPTLIVLSALALTGCAAPNVSHQIREVT